MSDRKGSATDLFLACTVGLLVTLSEGGACVTILAAASGEEPEGSLGPMSTVLVTVVILVS
jgi:hypothetical protein